MICSDKQRSAVAAAATAKTARACDSCLCRRARWYCAADDAFLCQNCDSSVHSANPLARRHHRVRVQSNPTSRSDKLAPSWHHGFKRKARTPRPSKAAKIGSGATVPAAFVPELETSGEDVSNEEEQLLYRVPIFDPVAEFCSPPLADHATDKTEAKPTVNTKVTNYDTNPNTNDQFLAGLLQSDAELAEFAADMESLLGRGLDNNSFSMEELGLIDAKYGPEENGHVKEEYLDNDVATADNKLYEEIDLSRETLEINFDCRSGDDDEQEEKTRVVTEATANEDCQETKKIGLRLDYEAIAAQWSEANGALSPWVNGKRPQLSPDACLLDNMGMWGGGEVRGLVPGEMGGIHFDEGREARVSRYREKRRTRLFSKKIRYEVRKLNAEKRPRMKGRFVKRQSFTVAAAAAGAPAAFKY